MTRKTIRMTTLAMVFLASLGGACSQKEDVKTVGIATLMSHPALDALQTSMIEEMTHEGFIEGKNIRYEKRNANGQPQLTATIASELAGQRLDAIVAITTPMAQAVLKVSRVPVVFGAVTDPLGAGVVTSLTAPAANVTGTSDAWPYQAQLELIRAISPSVKRLGFLFNPGESAAAYGLTELRRLAPAMGFELVEGPVSSTTDVFPVASQLAGRVDALLVGSDNTAIAGVAGAVKVAASRKIPLYVGDSGTVEKGGLAAVSVGYAGLGRETGRLLAKMLRGERGLPIVSASGDEIYLNTKAAELMGVKIPEAVLSRATRVYSTIGK
jgi:putative ABC transport system substrate-binding protein